MRILQIGLSHNPGGVESFVMNYYRELTKYGVQFDFISCTILWHMRMK